LISTGTEKINGDAPGKREEREGKKPLSAIVTRLDP